MAFNLSGLSSVIMVVPEEGLYFTLKPLAGIDDKEREWCRNMSSLLETRTKPMTMLEGTVWRESLFRAKSPMNRNVTGPQG